MEKNGQLHAPVALPQEESVPYPLDGGSWIGYIPEMGLDM
jgi:hypothetical protein